MRDGTLNTSWFEQSVGSNARLEMGERERSERGERGERERETDRVRGKREER